MGVFSGFLEALVKLETAQRPNRLNIDMQGYKQPWLDWCKAHGVTPSQAFRQVAAKLMQQDQLPSNELAAGADDAGDDRVRKEIRLTQAEAVQAETAAYQEGFSLSRWIVALIRARLTGEAQFGQHELDALARSNLQMLAIGRNLNQIARALNSAPNPGHYRVELVEELQLRIKEHTRAVSAVMSANVNRWK